MRIVINAGHTKIGTSIGAYKYLNESRETRRIPEQLCNHIILICSDIEGDNNAAN